MNEANPDLSHMRSSKRLYCVYSFLDIAGNEGIDPFCSSEFLFRSSKHIKVSKESLYIGGGGDSSVVRAPDS